MSTETLGQFQANANPTDWALANSIAQQQGIPSNIFLALVAQESSWNPNAHASTSSATGYTQLTAGTALQLDVNASDPAQNLQGGAEYLKSMFDKFGNWTDALAHYYAGPNATNPATLAAGQQYAQSIMALANTASTGATGGAAPAPAPAAGSPGANDAVAPDDSPSWVSQLLSWIKAQAGNFFFLLIGGALVLVALLTTDTGQKVAKTAAETAVA